MVSTYLINPRKVISFFMCYSRLSIVCQLLSGGFSKKMLSNKPYKQKKVLYPNRCSRSEDELTKVEQLILIYVDLNNIKENVF